jgi:SGNH hydrolase-like domain, acetyltransferase AlgX
MKRVVGRLVAVMLGVAVAVMIGEVAVRFAAPQPLQHIQLDDQIYFVNRPLARFTYAREGEYSIDVAYNAWGFRGPIPDSIAAPGTTRILLIGDSQTEGLQVRLEETYGEVLRRTLERLLSDRRFEVVNLGVSAYGTHQEVLTLRRYGARVRPCWVVLGFYPDNDFTDNVRLPLVTEGADGVQLAEHRYSPGHRMWLSTKVWLASVSHLYTFSVSRIKALVSQSSLARGGISEPLTPANEGMSRPIRLTEHLLLIARRDTNRLGARFLVLMIPARSQVMRPEPPTPTVLDDIEQQFASWFARERIASISPLTSLREAYLRGERPFFKRDGHMNSTGHRVVGEALAHRMAPLIAEESRQGSCPQEQRR